MQQSLAEKVEAAKQYLGEAWVLHPLYDPARHPAHSSRGPYVLSHIKPNPKGTTR